MTDRTDTTAHESNGDWVPEHSSGYAGFRCRKCATWVYEDKPKVCDCDNKPAQQDAPDKITVSYDTSTTDAEIGRIQDKVLGCFLWMSTMVLVTALGAMIYSVIDGVGIVRGWWP